MKEITITTILVAVFTLFSLSMNAQKGTEEAIKNLKAYDKVLEDSDLERYVIYVDQQETENLFEVELIAGKKIEADCNTHRLLGRFVEETVQGWGFNYYVFATDGHVASTMMACPDGTKTEKFISGQSLTVRYNSRLPLVIYLPKGYDLQYKIWTAGEAQSAEKQ